MSTVVRAAQLANVPLPGRLSADPFDAATSHRHGLSVRIVTVDSPDARTAHLHPHSAEVTYVASGSGVHWSDGTETQVSAGDVLLVPPGTPHATRPEKGERLVLVCFFAHPDLAANIQELPTRVTR